MQGFQHPIVIRPRTTDRFVFEQIFLDRDYEVPFEPSPQFIVDAGANVGLASIYFANKYADATIIALEPELDNFAILVRNTRDYPRIVPMRAALWSRCETLSLDNQRESWSCRVSAFNKSGGGTADGITMAELLRHYGRSSIDILKMDIEGAEREIFSSECRSWLSRTRLLIIELHDHINPGCSQALDAAISDLRFSRTEQGENTILMNRECPTGDTSSIGLEGHP
jgi:FkbM family methyltransferase